MIGDKAKRRSRSGSGLGGKQRPAARSAIRSRRGSADWAARYAGRLVYSDALVIAVTLFGYSMLGIDDVKMPVAWPSQPDVPYWLVLIVFALAWLAALAIFDTRNRHIVGSGVGEYRRIVNATSTVFGALVIFCFFVRMDLARGLFVIALPVGIALLVLSRWLWRQWLRARQRRRTYVYRAVVAGEPQKVAHVIESIRRSEGSGFDIVGAVTARGKDSAVAGVPVLGGYDAIQQIMDGADIDTLIITSADDLGPEQLRHVGWAVADRDKDLVVALALTDVAGPRIHSRPVAGLPLVYVSYPMLEGYKRFIKRSFDIVASSLMIALASPLLIGTAIAIRLDGPGPIFYQQTRIGRRGNPFGMMKFRSMVANADDQLASLLDLQGTSAQPLHKVINDPRITKIGRFIRKYSIDELPQLFNVFLGTMSLVGPRPQREAEVALYDDAAHRRLLVKPGMSGLWQVSGRSALSWDDAIRLDLYYVENWSFTQDIQILFRTVRAVVAPGDSAH